MFEIQFKMRERFVVVTEVWTCLFVYKIIPENIEKLTSCTVNGELFVNIFLCDATVFEG